MRYLEGPSLGFDDVRARLSFFLTVPERKPRTLCCCQPVASIKSSMLAPWGWFNSCKICACFVTRESLERAVAGFGFRLESAVFCCLADAFITPVFRRSSCGGLDFSLGWVVFVVIWAPWVRSATTGARTTQSPAFREASPYEVGRPSAAVCHRTNACFREEVQANETRFPGTLRSD